LQQCFDIYEVPRGSSAGRFAFWGYSIGGSVVGASRSRTGLLRAGVVNGLLRFLTPAVKITGVVSRARVKIIEEFRPLLRKRGRTPVIKCGQRGMAAKMWRAIKRLGPRALPAIDGTLAYIGSNRTWHQRGALVQTICRRAHMVAALLAGVGSRRSVHIRGCIRNACELGAVLTDAPAGRIVGMVAASSSRRRCGASLYARNKADKHSRSPGC
jgi:hypothetical protein